MISKSIRLQLFAMLVLVFCAHATSSAQSNSPSSTPVITQSQPEKEKPMPSESTPSETTPSKSTASKSTKFNKVTPNLVVRDLEMSIRFYRDVLGFSVSQTVPDKAPFIFAWMKRDEADIFLNANMPPQPGEPDLYAGKTVGGGTMSLYLVMEGIDDLYARVQHEKVPIVIAMHKQFYGMREFAVHDPDGHLLIFAQEER